MSEDGWSARPSPVLLVQERDHPGHGAHGGRQRRRGKRGHQSGLAQVARDLRRDEEQEAGPDTAQDDLLHAPKRKKRKLTAAARSTMATR